MGNTSRIGITFLGVAVLATGLAVGCASTQLRTEASTSGIRAAEEIGAAKVPRAALHLQLAREGLEKARALSADGESKRAASLLLRSEADAELAVALAREHNEQAEARAALERVRKLRLDNP